MHLIVLHSEVAALVGRVIPLDPTAAPLTIGRDPGCALVVDSPSVSRRHARVAWADGAWWLFDDGSTHGVFVGESRVERVELTPELRFWVGGTLLVTTPRRPIVESAYAPLAADGLTGLATRRTLLAWLDEALRDPAKRVSLVRFDVDGLIRWNRDAGHEVVDGLLAQLAARMRAEVGSTAMLARVGGDDFALALPDVEPGAARARAAEIRSRVTARAFLVGEHSIRLSLSAGVACEPRTPEGLLRAAEDDLFARRARASKPGASIEWATGLWSSGSSRSIDVAAAAAHPGDDGASALAVADGAGGHATGWLGARLAVREWLARCGAEVDAACLEGAGDLVPDAWGWAGATRSREAGEEAYAACVAALRELTPASSSDDPAAWFSALHRVIATMHLRCDVTGLLVSCTAARVVGARVHGAHAGVGRASVLRVDGAAFEHLASPQLLPRRDGPGAPPPRVVRSALGALAAAEASVDTFSTELHPGDVLLLASGPVAISDAELVGLLRDGRSLREQARALERRLDEALARADPGVDARDVAVVLARCTGERSRQGAR